MKRSILPLALILAAGCATASPSGQVLRLSPREAHQRTERGQALLVCAYPADKCLGTHLAGAITFEELEERLPALRANQEIIFFCG